MLDENLPTFYIKSNVDQKHNRTIYLSQHGNEPEPTYTLCYPDPSSPESKNRYAAGLSDPFVTNVIYGEVLVVPEWTQPTLSAETIRQNGGVQPPPEPILPTQFTIQLYDPDQHITVRYKRKTWNTPATWEFEMPQLTFRQPSNSTLDQTQSDPAAADVTPKLKFSWRKDSKLSKDLVCLLSGKTSNFPEVKGNKNKEPDITISIFQALREITLYEPNLYRVEMEDFKGLEIVLLLSAVAIRDIYFTPIKEAFHVSNSAVVPNGDAPASPQSPTQLAHPLRHTGPARGSRADLPRLDTRTQREGDAENARLRQEQDFRAKEEERRMRKLLEAEEKTRRKKQAEVDKETRRLQKLYGKEEARVRASSTTPAPVRPMSMAVPSTTTVNLSSPPPPRNNGSPPSSRRYYIEQHHPAPSVPNVSVSMSNNSPYLQPPARNGRAQQSSTHLLQPPRPQSVAVLGQPQLQPKRSSFFGFRKSSSESTNAKLAKKRSSMF